MRGLSHTMGFTKEAKRQVTAFAKIAQLRKKVVKPSGVINLDKPGGISSAQAVARVKRLLPRGTKIGHAGTLDPFACGVLLLLIGKATKLCESVMNERKQYEATIKLGATTRTDDPESPEQIQ